MPETNEYYRRISPDALTRKTLNGVMITTDSDEHLADMFRVHVDNIQITPFLMMESIFRAHNPIEDEKENCNEKKRRSQI